MRWKLLRRRLSISSPRVTVRRQLPWPLRWAVWAVMLGFSAAIAVWAFDFGRSLAGVQPGSRAELQRLRAEVEALRAERERAVSIANTADSLLKAEKVAQERLAVQLKAAEADVSELRNDLHFFERLLPAKGGDGPTIRSLQAESAMPGQVRWQMLLMQPGGKRSPVFNGRYDVTLAGTLDDKAWSWTPPGGGAALQLKQYLRLDGSVDHVPAAVIKTISVRVLDGAGAVKTTLTARLGQSSVGE